MVNDRNWQANFEHVIAHSGFPELSEFDPVIPKLVQACLDLEKVSDSFKRQSLQTRFFETGDNFYLGMEFNREFDAWKKGKGPGKFEIAVNQTLTCIGQTRSGSFAP